MAIGARIIDGEFADRPADVVVSPAVIFPALAYGDPWYSDWPLPAGQWVEICQRDIERAMFTVVRTSPTDSLYINTGTNKMASPFTMDKATLTFSLRYVDMLTVVTGEVFALSVAGETISVIEVRKVY